MRMRCKEAILHKEVISLLALLLLPLLIVRLIVGLGYAWRIDMLANNNIGIIKTAIDTGSLFCATSVTVLALFTSCIYSVQSSALYNMKNAAKNVYTYHILAEKTRGKENKNEDRVAYNRIANKWFELSEEWEKLHKKNCIITTYLLYAVISMFFALCSVLVLYFLLPPDSISISSDSEWLIAELMYACVAILGSIYWIVKVWAAYKKGIEKLDLLTWFTCLTKLLDCSNSNKDKLFDEEIIKTYDC